jgi:HSP20 family protein
MGIPYSSLHFLSRVQAELEHLFKGLSQIREESLPSGEWLPSIDVVETAESIVILAELPGMAASDIRLEVKGSWILLSGSKPSLPPAVAARFLCMERSRGRFEREIQISAAVNTHQGRARLEDGLLVLELPKIAEQRASARLLAIEEVKKS